MILTKLDNILVYIPYKGAERKRKLEVLFSLESFVFDFDVGFLGYFVLPEELENASLTWRESRTLPLVDINGKAAPQFFKEASNDDILLNESPKLIFSDIDKKESSSSSSSEAHLIKSYEKMEIDEGDKKGKKKQKLA